MTDPSPTAARNGARSTPVSNQDRVSILPALFLICLLIPVQLPVGSLALMPHRVFLLLVFFPLSLKLLFGQAGRLIWVDYALIFSACWATISLAISKGTGVAADAGAVQAIGIHWVEFWGAYLVGRVCIRSPSEFIRFVWVYFIIMLILLPFAAAESITHQPVFLSLFPNHLAALNRPLRWGLRRAQVAFAHPILFGVFVSSAFGLFWYVLRPTFFRITGIAACVGATIFSLSMGAYISMVVQIFFISWEFVTNRINWRWRLFIGISAAFYILVDMLSNRTPFQVLVTYASFDTASDYMRILIWEWGVDNVTKRPWFGLGLDIVNWERPYWKSPSADNFWLLTAMNYGVPALVPFLGAVMMIVWKVSRTALTDPVAKRCQAGFLTTLGGIVVAGGTVHYWNQMLAFVMFIFGSGVWIFTSDVDKAPDDETEVQKTPDQHPVPKYTRFDST